MAVNDVNSHDILPGYKIKLLVNDTKCDPGVGVDRFFHAIYSRKPIVMLLGSGCSNVTESLAKIVPYWNILQVSFGSTSPVLSDRKKFPLFFRTVTPESAHNAARTAFIKYYKWEVIATFSQSENAFLLPVNNLVTQLERENITCTPPITFSRKNYREQLRVLKDLDTRIIVGSFSITMATKIFCEVYRLRMYGSNYVWILQDYDTIWWSNATCGTLTEALNGVFLVSHHNKIPENDTSISGLTNGALERKLNITEGEISKFSKQTYDAIWAMGLALHHASAYSSLMLKNFHYRRKDMAATFVRIMETLNFMGVSGPVTFDGADRMANTIFKQVQGGHAVDVAMYYPLEEVLDLGCGHCEKLQWPGGQVPIARRILKLRLITVPKVAFISIAVVSSLGIVAGFVFLYFNLHFRRTKSVKISSPRLNNVAVLGCIVVYVSVILLGLDEATLLDADHFSKICMVRVYLLSAGFSLAFGSMFAKTYRVNKIFTYSAASIVKDKFLKDKQLITFISVLLVIDAVIISLWIMVDPMKRYLHNMAVEHSSTERGVVYQPQVEVCKSNNTTGWFIAIYGYKGCLLIMGVYMAWEGRHIKVAALNDSQYIGICVYSAFSSAVVVVLSNFLSEYPTFSYLATTVSILISVTITLFLLFLPKLRDVYGRVDCNDPIMQSMGLKFECNTKRLVKEDARELIYRVEVQNRVYKEELRALDVEIARLEELLARHDQPSPSNNEIYVISSTDNQPAYLSVPVPSTSRASWPMCVDDRITQKKNIWSSSKLRRLKEIFGSIPSLRSSVVEEQVHSDVLEVAKQEECSVEERDEEKELRSAPEFVTLLLPLPQDENLRVKSASASGIMNK